MADQEFGQKDTKSKLDVSLVPSASIAHLARCFAYGVRKYSRGSWRKGFPDSDIAAAMQRHYLLWRSGESIDIESGEPHLAMLAWNALALLSQQELGRGVRDLDFDQKEVALLRHLLYGEQGLSPSKSD